MIEDEAVRSRHVHTLTPWGLGSSACYALHIYILCPLKLLIMQTATVGAAKCGIPNRVRFSAEAVFTIPRSDNKIAIVWNPAILCSDSYN